MNRGELFVALSQDAFVNEITNPFFQARLLRIYHKVKAGCRMFLGNLSLEDFLSAYDELELLLKIGHTVGKNADTTLSVEAAELHWCNFLTLQNLFEKHSYLISDIPVFRFTDFQMYGLIALTDLGFAETSFLKLSRPYRNDVESSCAHLIEFSSCLLGAEEVINYLEEILILRVTGKTITQLNEREVSRSNDRKKGGSRSRYESVRPLFRVEAKKKWDEQMSDGVVQFKKNDMCDYLLKALHEQLPAHPTRSGERIKPSQSVIWDEWLKDIKPAGARNKIRKTS